MAKNGKRLESVQKIFTKYEMEPSHAVHVKRLALQLFDGLESLHGLGDREREWLEAAALLHDIGWSQAGKSHHKNSMKLILKEKLDNWTSDEQRIVANVVRYHRKSEPKKSHKNYAGLPPADRQKVRRLAALLRLADGLDRSHGDVVDKIDCQIQDGQVLLTLTCQRDFQMEHYGFEKKKNLFENVFGLRIIIHDIKSPWD